MKSKLEDTSVNVPAGEKIRFDFEKGAFIDPETGFFEKGHSTWVADFHFYRVSTGDRIIFSSRDYQYGVASYSSEIEDRFIYTYCYQPEENWSSYRGDFRPDKLKQSGCHLLQDGWIRVALKRADDAILTEKDMEVAAESITLLRQKRVYVEKDYFKPEIEKTAATVNEIKNRNSLQSLRQCDGADKGGNRRGMGINECKTTGRSCLVFGLMADSHYYINGGWEDSISNLRAVHQRVNFDAMVHLGDLTDGMLSCRITREYANRTMEDLHSLQIPLYLALGNHDSNYFHNNPEWLNEQEQSRFYLKRKEPWYYVDFEKEGLRCLFLFSFNHREAVRYGFPEKEIEWVQKVLKDTPSEFCTLIFSHVPLLPEMHFWSREIRNSEKLLKLLEEYVLGGGNLLAFIHGHNHADQIHNEKVFPIVSIGCAKCENFKDKKPQGSVTYDRKMGTVSQELWDVLVVNTKRKEINFVRFGAGEDRRIEGK